MKFALDSLATLDDLPFDEVIDVRSPAEYAEDHIPGAINLPVLDDQERARVGTIYVQEAPFKARKIGAAIVARHAADYIDGPLADRDGGWQPLVYCWRGGQRSNSFASILHQIGWRVRVLDGGYRSYRRLVVRALYDEEIPHRIVLLDGNTGTAKTDLLLRVQALGAQMLDLEGLAAHRGSVFGPVATAQPSQKMFETRLAAALRALDPARPVLVEAESNRIGNLLVPASMWKAMRAAPRIRLKAPLASRAQYLTRAYADLVLDRDKLESRINALRGFHAREQIEEWLKQAADGDHVALARTLMERHYDPRYAKSQERLSVGVLQEVEMSDMSDADLDRTAARLVEIMDNWSGPQPD